MLKIVG